MISALLLYRVIYYFVPLLLAGSGLLAYEAYNRRQALIEGGLAISRLLSGVIPQTYSLLLLLAGSVLLVSGAIPTNSDTLNWLSDVVPLPVVELSHMAGSLIGLLLLFLARGIRLKSMRPGMPACYCWRWASLRHY